MEEIQILYDYQEICQFIPEGIVRSILSKKSDDNSLRDYVNINISRNQKDWLWRAFIKLIMPFQMKSTKDGKKKVTIIGYFYFTFFMTFFGMFYSFGILKYIMIMLWIFVILKACMPWITAWSKLLLNKNYYRIVLNEGKN